MLPNQISRPIEHSIMPMDLQGHFTLNFKPPAPEETDMFLRVGALHCRSMIIVDSDLNNNPVMQTASGYRGGVFWDALSSGFLRRAVREDGGTIATQSEVLEGLRRVSPKRAEMVPPDYVRRLDLIVARAEHRHEPLVWRRSEVDKYSLRRLRLYLRALPADAQKPSDLIRAVLTEVENRIADGSPFGAADIEKMFEPPDDPESNSDWRYIWDVTAQAQGGNIPFVFKGALGIGTAPGVRDRFLAAGPKSVGLEDQVEAQLYRSASKEDLRVHVEERAVGDRPRLAFEINWDKLSQLHLEEIEDLREEALGGNFFQARFNSTGSGSDLLEFADPYEYSLNEYHDRLAQAGILRTSRMERAAVTEALRRVVLSVEKENEIVEFIMRETHRKEHAVAEANVVMCDSSTIVKLLGEEGARRLNAQVDGFWTYRRPDYRVLERLDEDNSEAARSG